MAKDSVVIIDYGSGNLRSAAKSFERVVADEALGIDIVVSANPEDVRRAARVVLPGQGAFGDCIKGLRAIDGMIDVLQERVLKQGAPFLGICVGMQLLADQGLEHGIHKGLGWIPGRVVPIAPKDPHLKIPHMGWNELVFPAPGDQDNRHFVLRSASRGDHYYFVHSFMFESKYDHHILGMTQYGELIPAIVGRDNILGVQFHPEKSQNSGLKLVSEFLKWRP
jgi:glutamine amidotransferase